MIVVDSSVWISNLRNTQSPAVRKLRAIEDTEEILIGDLILLEVLQGAWDEAHAARLEREMRQFNIARMLDEVLAIRAASNYRVLRTKGVTIRKTMDVIIATFCIENGHRLLHEDRDFSPFSAYLGLVVA